MRSMLFSKESEVKELSAALKLASHNEPLQEAQNKVRDQAAEIRRLTQDLAQQKNFVTEVGLELQKALNVSRRAQVDRDNLQVDVQRARTSLKNAVEKHSELQETFRVQMELKAQRDHTQSNEKFVEMEIRIKNYERQVPDLLQKYKFSENARETLAQQFEAAWKAKEQAEKDLVEQLALLKKLKQEQAGRLEEDEEQRCKLSEVMASKRAILEDKFDLEQKMTYMAAELAQANAVASALKLKVNENAQHLALMRSQFEEKEKKFNLRALKPAANQLEQILRDTEEKLEVANKNLSQLKIEAQNLEVSLATSEGTAKKLADTVSELQRQFTSQREELSSEFRLEYDAKISALEKFLAREKAKSEEDKKKAATALKNAMNNSGINPQLMETYKRRERELRAVVAKLVVSESSSEAQFSCYKCLQVYNHPVICIPCGHNYCRQCLQESKFKCAQCRETPRETTPKDHKNGEDEKWFSNSLLEELVSKFVFRKQALASLVEMTKESIFVSDGNLAADLTGSASKYANSEHQNQPRGWSAHPSEVGSRAQTTGPTQ